MWVCLSSFVDLWIFILHGPELQASCSLCFQIGNGVSLDSVTSDEVEIDTTDMNPCILAPPQCTSGATYMFWIKHLNGLGGAILTTMDWHPPSVGIRFEVFASGILYAQIRRYGARLNQFTGHTPGFHDNIDTWQHTVVVWKTDPKLEIYLDGEAKMVSQGVNYADHTKTVAAPMRMFLGREFVTHTASLTNKMIFDELILFDRPLDADDLVVYFN